LPLQRAGAREAVTVQIQRIGHIACGPVESAASHCKPCHLSITGNSPLYVHNLRLSDAAGGANTQAGHAQEIGVLPSSCVVTALLLAPAAAADRGTPQPPLPVRELS